MDSFFFIPGNKLDKINFVTSLEVTEVIIDLEDAIKYSEREPVLERLLQDKDLQGFYIRVPLYDNRGYINTAILEKLIHSGFKKYVFPKINSLNDFEKISVVFQIVDIKIILLVETPLFFFEVREVLSKYKGLFTGIGIGSHDFMSIIGGVHTLDNINYIRQNILYLARAYGISAIDIASMELKDEVGFKDEIIDGFKKGYDAKFFIHPWQFTVYKGVRFYDEKDYNWALKVNEAFSQSGHDDEFNPVMIDGQVIERPHLNKMKQILKHYKK